MSIKVNIHEAKTNLSKLLTRVAKGEEVIISKAGKPVAKLVSITKKSKKRLPGSAKGKVIIEKNFYAPLPKDLLKVFEK
jgi:prevent-host-death family protein